MSCYPKELEAQDDPDLLKAAKLLRYAKFAVRFQSKSMQDLNEAKPMKSTKKKRSVPGYMRKSKATLRREAEIQRKREVIIENNNLAAAEDERRRADKIAALEAELARLKFNEGQGQEIMPKLEKENEKESVAFSASSANEDFAMPPISSPSKEEEKPASVRQFNLKLSDDGGGAMPKGESTPMEKRGERTGDKRSFAFRAEGVLIPKLAAKRCYRILTYRDLPDGRREVTDIPNGDIYYCKTGPQLRRITPYGVAFDSKEAAISERFPANQVGAALSGNGTTPRILVSFDCWGKTHRRKGGIGAAKYQYCKFIRIEGFLDASKTVSKKNSEHPVKPHYYPKADRRKAPRSPIDRAIYLDKCFNVRPWDPAPDARPFTPEYTYTHYKPPVPGHKVKPRQRDG
jgi:hypothetical protein